MAVELEWLGHACFIIRGNDTILIDPFLTGNPLAPKGPGDIECDIVAVTHGHGDHLGDAIDIAKRTGAVFVGIHELTEYAAANGVEKVEGMNIGGTIEVASSRFTMVPAWHSSGVGMAGYAFDGGLPAGFVIDTGKIIYHTGDTALFSDMKLIAELYQPEIACLPIGDRYTMGPREAAIAAEWLKAGSVIPMHYKTFEVLVQDAAGFEAEVKKRCDAKVVVLEPGETARFD